MMMKTLLEKADIKKKSRRGKKKRTLTPSQNSEGEEDHEYVEESLEHREKSDSGDNSSQRMNELEKRLEAITNRGKLQESGINRPYPLNGIRSSILLNSNSQCCTTSLAGVSQINISTTSSRRWGTSCRMRYSDLIVCWYSQGGSLRMVHEARVKVHPELERLGEAYSRTIL